MAKIVYFLGAGASYPFGIPLTKELLPQIIEKATNKALFKKIYNSGYSETDRRKMEEELMSFLEALMPGLTHCFQNKNLPLITDILSIIDHMMANKNIPYKLANGKPMSYYRLLLDRAIYEILNYAEPRNAKEKNNLDKFLKKIEQHINNKDKITFITTNYDTTFEIKVYNNNIKDIKKIDFGFSWRDTQTNHELIHYPVKATQIRIFKLHGSLNWLKCDLCDHIYINPYGNIIDESFRSIVDENNTCHCGNGPLKSIIISPSFERDVRDANLLHIWKSSLLALREADEWNIIGYSLPAEDLAIKSLIIRGKNKNKNQQYNVVQFGEDAKPAYDLFFGVNAYQYINGGLESFLGQT